MGGRMTLKNTPLVHHLKELQWRFCVIIVSLLFGTVIAYTQSDMLLYWLVAPLKDAYGAAFKLFYLGLAEGFLTHLKLSFYFGFILIIPIILWQVWGFAMPGLHTHERTWLCASLITAPLLFILGAGLAYFLIIPQAWHFFLYFANVPLGPLPQEFLPHAQTYLSLTMSLLFAFGLCFELPLILVLLGKLGFIRAQGLRQKRRYVIVGMFIIGAILTPPDIFSQIGLAIPLIVFYEIAILIIALIEKRAQHD